MGAGIDKLQITMATAENKIKTAKEIKAKLAARRTEKIEVATSKNKICRI